MSRRVLVTGGTGFVGRHVLAPLTGRGFEVHVTSRRTPAGALPHEGVVAHEVDLLAPDASAALVRRLRPSHLVHLAWISNLGQTMAALDNLSWAAASLHLYRTFVETGGRRAVLAGTCAEYDWSHGLLSEARTPSRPATLYGAAKNAVREVVEAAGREAGVSTAWARIFFLYGPHEPSHRLVAAVATALLEGRRAETTDGRQERDFLHVADAGEALAALLDSDVTGTVNIGSGECVEIRRIVELLGTLAGRPDLLAIGARPPRPGDPGRLAADVTRLTREVGFVPRHRLEAGLAETLEWWRTHGRD